MKKNFSKAIASLAIGVTKVNVNSFCWSLLYQPKLPEGIEKIKNKNFK